jgi:hypothetical protein
MKIFRGERTARGQRVTLSEDGQTWLIRHEERHSPNGFDWGPRDRRVWGGGIRRGGAADLALALLTEVCGRRAAEQHYQDFAREIFEEMPREVSWEISENDIAGWMDSRPEPSLSGYRR